MTKILQHARRLRRALLPGRAAAFVFLLASLSLAAFTPAGTQELSRVQQLLDAGDGRGALELLEPMLRSQGRNADILLAYSTALFLTGDNEEGEKALRRAVDRDPTLLQGWLNLGALRIAQGKAAEAAESFQRARSLAPGDPDIALNLGVALLLSGQLEEARVQFDRYLAARGDRAEDHALVAQNYALANAVADATKHAAVAISKNERLRLDMRTNSSFARALDDPGFLRLLATDSFEPEPGSLRLQRKFDETYDIRDAKMIGAVVDSLNTLEIPFDPRIEATPEWALIWTERFRLKLAPRGAGTLVTITAPPRSFGRAEWQSLESRLWAQIEYDLAPKLPVGARPPR